MGAPKNVKTAIAVGTMAAAGALLGAAAVTVQRRHCLQVLRTHHGLARVHVVRGEDGEPVRVLSQGGVYQSASYLGERRFEPVFSYYRGFDALFASDPSPAAPPRSILMIGGGGFSYPKHLLTTAAGIRLDVVELDAAVVRAARRWFFLDDLERRLADPATANGNALRIIVGDGRDLLERGAGEVLAPAERMGPAPSRPRFAAGGAGRALRPLGPDEVALPSYDAIINDAFAGSEPVAALATVEAARAVRRRLAPEGLYLVNAVSADAGRDLGFLRDEVATLREVFSRVQVIDTSDEAWGGEGNYLIIATDRAVSFPGAIAYDDAFPGRPLHDATAAGRP
ncbi:MAG: fused MFS/spermidine synthase [Collinsella sp.]|nr:fused MFS/spermidine synthase [Collinsella sp.]